MSSPSVTHCPTCGQPPDEADPAVQELLKQHALNAIANLGRFRPQRLEEVFRSLNEEDRLGLHGWLRSALRRPPLAGATYPATFAIVAAVLDALAWDLAEATPDPLSPTFEYDGSTWVMPERHVRVLEHDAGVTYVSGALSPSRRVVVDGHGLEVPAEGT